MNYARRPVRFRRLGLGMVAMLATVVASLALTASPASAKPVRISGEPAAVAAAAGISCNTSYTDSSFGIRCTFPARRSPSTAPSSPARTARSATAAGTP